MPSYRVISTETISGEGELSQVVDALRLDITSMPPGLSQVGFTPPRLFGLGQIGFLTGDYRTTGQVVIWEQFHIPAIGVVVAGVWWQLIPGVEATLSLLALTGDSALDSAVLGYSGQLPTAGNVLLLT